MKRNYPNLYRPQQITLAEQALRLNRPDLAIEIAEGLLTDNPQDSDAHFLKGRAFADKKLYPAALRSLEEALRLNPENAYAHRYCAWLWWNSEAYEAAEREMRLSLSLVPNCANTHLLYGEFLFRVRRQTSQGRNHVLKALELEPNDPKALVVLAEMTADLDGWKGLKSRRDRGGFLAVPKNTGPVFRRALELAPNDPVILRAYGHYLAMWEGNYREAHACYRRFLAINPHDRHVRRWFHRTRFAGRWYVPYLRYTHVDPDGNLNPRRSLAFLLMVSLPLHFVWWFDSYAWGPVTEMAARIFRASGRTTRSIWLRLSKHKEREEGL